MCDDSVARSAFRDAARGAFCFPDASPQPFVSSSRVRLALRAQSYQAISSDS